VAAELGKLPGVAVELVDGSKGEFTVLVDGHMVAERGLSSMPSVEEVRRAVEQTNPVEARS
jgi:hypothetical protein